MRGRGFVYYLSIPEVSRRLMSFPVDPPVEEGDLADPFDDEDRPLWSDGEGPHGSEPNSEDERFLQRFQEDARVEALLRERRNIPFCPPAGPVLVQADAPRVTALATDLLRETRGRERFLAFPEEEFSAAAGILVRYRIHSLEVLRQTQRGARTLFLRDLAAYFIGIR